MTSDHMLQSQKSNTNLTDLRSGTSDSIIIESDVNNFMADVVDASASMPVLVDFWATWCGPCKQLTPILEKAVMAAQGAVRLVKIDIDANQPLAAQMRVASVPTVYGFVGGRPIDAFQGVLPESQIKAFIEKLIQASGGTNPAKDAEKFVEQAGELLEAGEAEAALGLYGQILSQLPDHVGATAGLLRALLKLNRGEDAASSLAALPESMLSEPEIVAVAKTLELYAKASSVSGEEAELRAKLTSNPDAHDIRFDLAMALYGCGNNEGAAEELLEIISRDRNWKDEAAKIQLLEFFETWGVSHPVTSTYRRKLSALLFS